MNKLELKEVLRKHQAWLKDRNNGEKANLSGANLRGADLSYANLSYVNLNRADLRGAHGFLLLPAQDLRGYSWPHAVLHDNWRIRAGCRFFTIEQAKEHWRRKLPGRPRNR